MSIRLEENQIRNLQQIEAGISGPDGANRLYTINGELGDPGTSGGLWSGSGAETFTVLVGPVFTRQQFARAIAYASVSGASIAVMTTDVDASARWHLVDVAAGWDDESGRVELRVGIAAMGQRAEVSIITVGFTVTILAEIAP